jgi:hypothetical protein
MKRTIRLIAFSGVLITASLRCYAQQTASAYASATIVTPISITPANDLDFGNIAVPPSIGGTVVIRPNGSRSATGGVVLPANSGNPAAAEFNIEGEEGFVYDIILPEGPLTLSSGSGTMTITGFTSDPVNTGQLSSGGQLLHIGATLYVSPAQPVGTYISATPFSITMNYN